MIAYLFCFIVLTSVGGTVQKSPSYHNHYNKDFIGIPETSIIMDKMGVILQEEKFMGLDSNNIMISLFVKSKFPLQNKVAPETCSSNTSGWFFEATTMINDSVNESMTLFQELLNIEKLSQPSGNKRSKRSILGFFNIGLNLFTSAHYHLTFSQHAHMPRIICLE